MVTALSRSAPPVGVPLTVKGGGPAKGFELENVRQGGPEISLARYRGRRVVVNFFASWCVPCRPALTPASLRLVVLVVALGLGVGACAGGRGAQQPASIKVGGEEVTTHELSEAALALCRAREQAGSDPAAARATFFDRSHQAIHTIARALEDVDRAAAARLLEAKQIVEADLAANPPPARLAGDFSKLADATRVGLGLLKLGVPACRT